jgi:glycosyltransferase involved in cell wall biosynthesis
MVAIRKDSSQTTLADAASLGNFFKDKTLLVVSEFPGDDKCDMMGIFVKDQIAVLKNYFKRVVVINPTPFFPSLLFGLLPGYVKKRFIKKDYTYDNVEVYFPRYLHFFKIRRKRKSWVDDLAFFAVEKIIEKHCPEFDLVHAHFTFPGGYIGIRIKDKYKKPLITTVHENYERFMGEANSGDKEIYKVWEKSDLLLSINQKNLDVLKSRNKNCKNIKNGYSTKKFKPVENAKDILGLPRKNRLILTVGSLMKKKGHIYLIEAMRRVIEKAEDAICVIIGEGNLKGELEKAIGDLGLKKNIHIQDRKSEEELNLWMNACDLFVLPSLSESFGIVQIEAMGCGKAVVATRNGGSEYILTSETGILVEKADPIDLSNAILKALSMSWDKEVIQTHSRSFDIELVSLDVLRGYRSLLKV